MVFFKIGLPSYSGIQISKKDHNFPLHMMLTRGCTVPRERVAFNAFRQRAAPIGGLLRAACDERMAGDERLGIFFIYILYLISYYINKYFSL